MYSVKVPSQVYDKYLMRYYSLFLVILNISFILNL